MHSNVDNLQLNLQDFANSGTISADSGGTFSGLQLHGVLGSRVVGPNLFLCLYSLVCVSSGEMFL